MIGHICTLLTGMVERHHGEEGVDRIFELLGVAWLRCEVFRRRAERVLTDYGEEAEVREIECVNRGATSCRIEVLFSRPSPWQPIRS